MSHLIHSSTNYEKFNNIYFNRPLCKKNLNKLIDLNKEKDRLHLFPIVVDKDLNIIDGQHRFEASKILEKPVHYVVDETKDNHWQQITEVNIAGKKHDITDLFKMLLADGDEHCKYVQDVKEELPFITVGDLCRYFFVKPAGNTTVVDEMRFRRHRMYESYNRLSVLKIFVQGFGYFKLNHINVFRRLLKVADISDAESIVETLKLKGFVPQKTWSNPTYKEEIARIYNKGKNHENRIHL